MRVFKRSIALVLAAHLSLQVAFATPGNMAVAAAAAVPKETQSQGPPAGTMRINGGAAETATTAVKLSMQMDSKTARPTSMRFSADNQHWSGWQRFATSLAYRLPPGRGTKLIYVQFRDQAGWTGPVSLASIVLDDRGPEGSVTISGGAETTPTPVVTLTLAAKTTSGARAANMRFSTDQQRWTAWRPFSPSLRFTLPNGNGTKTVHAQFQDAYGNVGPVVEDSIVLAPKGPIGRVLINSGAERTGSLTVNLSLSATAQGASVTHVRLSSDGKVWGQWLSFRPIISYKLAPPAGEKTVHAQFRDQFGNVGEPVQDSITLDTRGPEGSIIIASGAEVTKTTKVSLGLSARSQWPGSRVTHMRFSSDKANWTGWRPYVARLAYTLPPGDGTKVVYAQFRDVNGHDGPVVEDTIVLDTNGPEGTVEINGGAESARSPAVTLMLTVKAHGASATHMRLSSDGTTWGRWQPFRPRLPHRLLPPDGDKTVYVQFRDQFGNAGPVASDTIRLGGPVAGRPPAATVAINGGASWTPSSQVTLTVQITGSPPAGVEVRLSDDGKAWGEWRPLVPTLTHTLAAGDGLRTVYVQAQNQFGAGPVASASITVEAPKQPPTGTVVINGGDETTSDPRVTLTLTARGDGVPVTHMRLSGDGQVWGEWQGFAGQRAYEFTEGTGPRTVFAQFRDARGLVSETVSDDITVVSPRCRTPKVQYVISADTVWPACQQPYVIDREIRVSKGTLTIEPGAVLKFGEYGAISIGLSSTSAGIKAIGTAAEPIIFTSVADDSIGGDGNGSSTPTAEDWSGIGIGKNGRATFEHIQIRHGRELRNEGQVLFSDGLIDGKVVSHGSAGANVSLNRVKVLSGGIRSEAGTLSVTDSEVVDFTEAGIYADGSTILTVIGNRLSGRWPNPQGTFVSSGIDINLVDDKPWEGRILNNTFSQSAHAIRFHFYGGTLGSGVFLSGNRGGANVPAVVTLYGEVRHELTLPPMEWPYAIGHPHYADFDLEVERGATLTVLPGTVFKSLGSNYLRVDGRLVAEGTPDSGITFTSVRDDTEAGDSEGDGVATAPAPGDWAGILVNPNASAVLRYVTLRYGGGKTGGAALQNGGDLQVWHSTITYNRNWAVSNIGSGRLLVRYSTFSEHPGLAFFNFADDPALADLRWNYWGDESGPRPFGSGNGVKCESTWGYFNGNCIWPVQKLPEQVIPWLGYDYVLARNFGLVRWADTVLNVHTLTGNFSKTYTDAQMQPGKGMPVAIQRTYNSQSTYNTSLGQKWFFNYDFRLTQERDRVFVIFPNGRQVRFIRQADGTYQAEDGAYETLTRPGEDFSLRDKSGTHYGFSADGKITSVTDHNGNTIRFTYGAAGHMTAIHSAGGQEFKLERDGEGRITAVTDPAGSTWKYQYDATGNLTSVTDSRGGERRYTYDGSHRLLTETDPVGAPVVRLEYDDRDRVVAQFDARGAKTTFNFGDDLKRETSVTDALGSTTRRTFDGLMRQKTLTDALGNTQYYEFDKNHNLSEFRDRNGNLTRRSADARGNLVSETDAEGATTTWTYDTNFDLPLTLTDALGQVTRFEYDARGNLVKQTDPLGNARTFTYDASGLRLTETDPLGNTTTFSYDQQGYLTTETDAMGGITRFAHEALGRRTSVTDPLNCTTSFTYLPTGEVATSTDAAGGTTTHTYDASGKRLSTTDALIGVTRFEYDDRGLLTQVTDALGGTTSYVYDDLGRRTQETDARGNRTTFSYDALGRLAESIDPLGGIVRHSFDAEGRLTATADARGHTTRYQYDRVGRQRQVEDALGNMLIYTFDALSRKTAESDRVGAETQYAYDAAGRLTKVMDPLGNVTTHTYDAAGRRVATTDPKGATTTYTHDALGRLTATRDPLGNEQRSSYDAAGQPTLATDANGHRTGYAYDNLGRLSGVTAADGSTTSYIYDAGGNLTQVTDALGRKRVFTYDLLGRPTAETDPLGQKVTYAYDAVGNRTETIDRAGGATTYTNDAMDRLVTITAPGGVQVSFKYDANGNRLEMTDSTGTTRYTYDEADRLTAVTASDGKTMEYRYNDAGFVTVSKGYDGVDIHRSFDKMGRLLSLGDGTYGRVTFTYDEIGNRTSITYQNGVKGNYTYDALGRPVQVEWQWQGGSGAATPLARYAYAYDPSGNITQRVEGSAPSASSTTPRTAWLRRQRRSARTITNTTPWATG